MKGWCIEMELQENTSIILFDRFKLSIPKSLIFHQDGDKGKRVLFITDSEEEVIVSFDEETQDCDNYDVGMDGSAKLNHFSVDGKSIDQFRNVGISDRCAFFLIKIANWSEKPLCLIGQMVVGADHIWHDGEVEPVLKKLLDCVTINNK